MIIVMFCYFSVWVARRPPGYAFIDFDDQRDAKDAIREIDGMTNSDILSCLQCLFLS